MQVYAEVLKDLCREGFEECRGAVLVALAEGWRVWESHVCAFESVLSFKGWVSGAISVPV